MRTPELRDRWLAWRDLSYPSLQLPPGSDASIVHGVDLTLAAGDFDAIFHHLFVGGSLEPDDRIMVRELRRQLPGAVEQLSGGARQYFSEALAILAAIDEQST